MLHRTGGDGKEDIGFGDEEKKQGRRSSRSRRFGHRPKKKTRAPRGARAIRRLDRSQKLLRHLVAPQSEANIMATQLENSLLESLSWCEPNALTLRDVDDLTRSWIASLTSLRLANVKLAKSHERDLVATL